MNLVKSGKIKLLGWLSSSFGGLLRPTSFWPAVAARGRSWVRQLPGRLEEAQVQRCWVKERDVALVEDVTLATTFLPWLHGVAVTERKP